MTTLDFLESDFEARVSLTAEEHNILVVHRIVVNLNQPGPDNLFFSFRHNHNEKD